MQKIYWILTFVVAVMFTMSGVFNVMNHPMVMENVVGTLMLPVYIPTLIGLLKLGGVISLLIPPRRTIPWVREWTYAGFFWLMIGAMYIHSQTDGIASAIPSIVLAIAILFLARTYRKLILL